MTAETVAPEVDDREARERAAYVAGLRALADLLDEHPDCPTSTQGSFESIPFTFFFMGEDAAERIARIRRHLGGSWAKTVTEPDPEYGGGSYFRLAGRVHGIHVRLVAERDEVCTRIVKGTTTVTTTVPDPDYVALAPMVERTEVVEDVEWVCGPLLADREPVQS